MKEKIKLIVLIILFVSLLLVVNNLLSDTKPTPIANEIESNTNTNTNINLNTNTEINTNTALETEDNTTTSVISSYDSNNSDGFYVDMAEAENAGKVLEVTEENFSKEVLLSRKKVLVEFYADWCSPCKTLSPILEEIAKENLDLKVVKVNVDESSYIASHYGANYIPLLVVIENGNEVDRAVGALPKKDILELIK